MLKPSTVKALYWSFWVFPLILYLLGLVGHWPVWMENLLLWISYPWSLATLDISLRIENVLGFGWLCFLAQLGLFILIPAVLDYILVITPVLWLWQRRRTHGAPIP